MLQEIVVGEVGGFPPNDSPELRLRVKEKVL
jgi:hypothetical protein